MIKAAILVAGLALVLGCTEQRPETAAAASVSAEIAACAAAIELTTGPANENIARVEKNCDHLTRPDQKLAAEVATKKSGVIVYLPPYEAKEARSAAGLTASASNPVK